jgi:uncharacterized protein (TIGR00251 family)
LTRRPQPSRRPAGAQRAGDHPPTPSLAIPVRVQARARQNEISAVRDGVLVIRVTAPPLDGRANQAIRRLLADLLGVRTADVSIVRGERSRDKLIRVDGVDEAAAHTALGL